ncbi:MAG TPA: PIN domain-containing protein [Tepidisphaeraceae bacterium]|jgi:PIN domain nuclease of toxin-antitoxin system|nr:PIN domain-containing protein [Tepidisphaeraceae bacterium]
MNLFLPDTHAVYWYEFHDPKLSPNAEQAFKDAEAGGALLLVHPIVLSELYWLLRKAGLENDFIRYVDFLQRNPVYRFEPITMADTRRLGDFDEIPEMHDRLIAISAERLGAKIVTRDPLIQACRKVTCVW